MLVVVLIVLAALAVVLAGAGRVSRFAATSVGATRTRTVLENLAYDKRTCATMRSMYAPLLAAGTCEAPANLPDSLPEGARAVVRDKVRSTCLEFMSVVDLGAAIDECTDSS
jgi:hypothetical protein